MQKRKLTTEELQYVGKLARGLMEEGSGMTMQEANSRLMQLVEQYKPKASQ